MQSCELDFWQRQRSSSNSSNGSNVSNCSNSSNGSKTKPSDMIRGRRDEKEEAHEARVQEEEVSRFHLDVLLPQSPSLVSMKASIR